MTEWQEHLRASGHRLTPQRELVLAAVEHLGHATPDEVYDDADELRRWAALAVEAGVRGPRPKRKAK